MTTIYPTKLERTGTTDAEQAFLALLDEAAARDGGAAA